MTKLVNWGHWLIAVSFGAMGAWLLGKFVSDLPATIQSFRALPGLKPPAAGEAVGYSINLVSLAWVPLLACAWGILKWRTWGQVVTIVFCALTILFGVQMLVLFGAREFGLSGIATISIACLVLTWLLLPSVRIAYGRKVSAV